MALREWPKATAVGVALVALAWGAGPSVAAAPLSGNHMKQGRQAAQHTADDPVEVDVEITSSGFPLSLTRYYHWNPQAASGLLGKGWRLGLEARLLTSASRVSLDDADGTSVVFTRQADGSYTAPAGAAYTLAAKDDGGYALTAQDGTVRAFDSAGRLTGIVNSAGAGIRLTYTSTGHLVSATDAEGRTAVFSSDSAGRLVHVTLADGARVTYAYTRQSYLFAVARVDGTVQTYTYDEQGHLIR